MSRQKQSYQKLLEEIDALRKEIAEIQETYKHYEQVIKNIEDIIFETDCNGKLTFVAGAYKKLLGRELKDLLGKNLFELSSVVNIPSESIQKYNKALATSMEKAEYVFGLDIGGKLLFFEVKEKIHYDKFGKVSISTGVIREITERRQELGNLKQELAETKNINSQLRAYGKTISHDLRQPLAVVNGWLQFLRSHYKDVLDADAKKIIDSAISNTDRMFGMIKHLLEYSKRGNHSYQDFSSIDCEVILKHTLENLKLTIERNNAIITHGDLPMLFVDATQFTQLLQNLIGNAIKFHKEGTIPRIHISAQKVGNEWLFSVRDNGIGIDMNHSDRIFTMFGKLHDAEEYEGFGIGLSTCKNIVVAHGGRIWFESEVGKGSTFYFTILDR